MLGKVLIQNIMEKYLNRKQLYFPSWITLEMNGSVDTMNLLRKDDRWSRKYPFCENIWKWTENQLVTLVKVEQKTTHIFIINFATPLCFILRNELEGQHQLIEFELRPKTNDNNNNNHSNNLATLTGFHC